MFINYVYLYIYEFGVTLKFPSFEENAFFVFF